ncbi:MAG: sulfurtransferase [Acidobacteriaceae bacterium]|nr:sulfurtransferase [Acidobacteriaceae bacterium]
MAGLEIEPRQAEKMLKDEGKAVIIDVREPEEVAQARMQAAKVIPMGSIPAALGELEGLADDSTLLVLCHHGVRSLQVAAWLRERGIEDCYSIAGGIDRWSCEIDPQIPRY